jgi:hypothetical protein
MDINFNPINTLLTSVNGNLRFLNQLLSKTGAIILIVGIVTLLVSIFIL